MKTYFNKIFDKLFLKSQEITLKLSLDEALVLFEFLSRLNETEPKDLFEDQAEEKILSLIEVQLEKQLVEPFMPNYLEIIAKARNNIRDEE